MLSEEQMEGQESRNTMSTELPDTSVDLIASQAPVHLALPPDSTIISSARPSITFAEWLNWHTSGSYRATTPSGEDPPLSPTTTTPDTPVGADTMSDADDGLQAGASEGGPTSESPPLEEVGVQGTGHTTAPAGNQAGGRSCAIQVPDCRQQLHLVSHGARVTQKVAVQLQLPGVPGLVTSLLGMSEVVRLSATLCKPLIEIKLGVLHRKVLPDPKFLQASGDLGTLALWLLPDSRMRLIWQSAPRDVLCRSHATAGGAGGVPPLPGVLAFTEDLVRVRGVATLQHLPAPEDTVVTLLPSDTSRRSFSISSCPAATSQLPRSAPYPGSSQLEHSIPNVLYFYLRDRDLTAARAQLERLSTLLRLGTTLAHEADLSPETMEVLESWYTSAQSANPDAQSVINPAAAAATAAAAGIATNPGGLLTEMGISACLAPPPRSQVCRERLLLAYEAHGGLAAALTGFRPPQIYNTTAVQMLALRDSPTGVVCNTITCGTVSVCSPRPAADAQSPPSMLLPAHIRAVGSVKALVIGATQVEVTRLGHQRLLTAVLDRLLLQRSKDATTLAALLKVSRALPQVVEEEGGHNIYKVRYSERRRKLLASAGAAAHSAAYVAGSSLAKRMDSFITARTSMIQLETAAVKESTGCEAQHSQADSLPFIQHEATLQLPRPGPPPGKPGRRESHWKSIHVIDFCDHSHPVEQYPGNDLSGHQFKDSDIDSETFFVKGSRTPVSSSVQRQAEADEKQSEDPPVLRSSRGLEHRRVGIQDLGALLATQRLASDANEMNAMEED